MKKAVTEMSLKISPGDMRVWHGERISKIFESSVSGEMEIEI